VGLNELIQDFENFFEELMILKAAYDQFIEQQVSKISLAEARQSMTEARDLKRLSYLGFVFAPLSLACSFFSINIEPLGGKAPLWAFIVASLAILGFAILVLLLAKIKMVSDWFASAQAFILAVPCKIKHLLAHKPANDGIYTLPVTRQQISLVPPPFEEKPSLTTVSVDSQGGKGVKTKEHESSESVTDTDCHIPDASSVNQEKPSHPLQPFPSSPREGPSPRERDIPIHPVRGNKGLNTYMTLRVRPEVTPHLVRPGYRVEFPDKARSAKRNSVALASLQYPIQRRTANKRAESSSGKISAQRSLDTIPGRLGTPTQAGPSGSKPQVKNTQDMGTKAQSAIRCTTDAQLAKSLISERQNMTTVTQRPDSDPSFPEPARSEIDNSQASVDARKEYQWTSLHMAAQNGHIDAIKALIASEANVDARGKNQWTPLHLAAQNGHVDAIKVLIAAQAIVDAREMDQWTPLHLAAQNGHADAIKTLVAAQAKVKARDKNQSTPLHMAAQNGHVEAINALIGARAKVKARDKDQWAPLHLAAQNGHVDAIKVLIAAQAIVDAREVDQWTPLHLAVQNGHIDAIKALIASGANVDARGKNQWTPLHLAAQNGHVDAIKVLIAAQAIVDARVDYLWTPLHLAAQNGHDDAVKALTAAQAGIDACYGEDP
jgi:ankyrin repeat protein